MNPIIIRLPFPPTVNTYWKRATFCKGRKRVPGMRVTERGIAYQADVLHACILQRVAHKRLAVNLTVDMVLYPPDRRIRDNDNYRKAPWDALTKAGFWNDDSQVREDTCVMAHRVKSGLLIMRIREADDPIKIPSWAEL